MDNINYITYATNNHEKKETEQFLAKLYPCLTVLQS